MAIKRAAGPCRRNFKTQEAAVIEKAAFELKSLRIGSYLHAVTTYLAEEQVPEAEPAFGRLAGNGRALREEGPEMFALYVGIRSLEEKGARQNSRG
jgi:hypothetical protein